MQITFRSIFHSKMTVMTVAEGGFTTPRLIFGSGAGGGVLGTTDRIIDDPNDIMCLPTCN